MRRKRRQRTGASSSANSFRNLGGMPSGPEALPVFKERSTRRTLRALMKGISPGARGGQLRQFGGQILTYTRVLVYVQGFWNYMFTFLNFLVNVYFQHRNAKICRFFYAAPQSGKNSIKITEIMLLIQNFSYVFSNKCTFNLYIAF